MIIIQYLIDKQLKAKFDFVHLLLVKNKLTLWVYNIDVLITV